MAIVMFGGKRGRLASWRTPWASWFGAALLLQGLDSLLSSTEKCIPKFLKTFCRRMLGSVHQLNLNWSWVMQQDNDSKHRSKSTTEWLQHKKICLLEWPSHSPDLNPIEMLWHELKRVVHTRHPKNIAELKPKFSLTIVQVWSTTTENVWLRLLLPKEGQPVFKSRGSTYFSHPTLWMFTECVQ